MKQTNEIIIRLGSIKRKTPVTFFRSVYYVVLLEVSLKPKNQILPCNPVSQGKFV